MLHYTMLMPIEETSCYRRQSLINILLFEPPIIEAGIHINNLSEFEVKHHNSRQLLILLFKPSIEAGIHINGTGQLIRFRGVFIGHVGVVGDVQVGIVIG